MPINTGYYYSRKNYNRHLTDGRKIYKWSVVLLSVVKSAWRLRYSVHNRNDRRRRCRQKFSTTTTTTTACLITIHADVLSSSERSRYRRSDGAGLGWWRRKVSGWGGQGTVVKKRRRPKGLFLIKRGVYRFRRRSEWASRPRSIHPSVHRSPRRRIIYDIGARQPPPPPPYWRNNKNMPTLVIGNLPVK